MMEDEAVRMSWLSGRPQRVLNLRRPPDFSTSNIASYAQWSVMDDQIMLTLPSEANATAPSTIYLADINASLERDDDVVEFQEIAKLSFQATRSRLLSNRAGFATVEFREDQSELILRTHDWVGNISREKMTTADSIDGSLVVNGSSIALCVGNDEENDEESLSWCDSSALNQIIIWDTESGDLASIQIPQDERAPQCHKGNFQFATPSYIALGGHIDPSNDKPYAVLRSFSTRPLEEMQGRYFHHHENFEFEENHDAIAIPGSSASNDVVVHHHQYQNRFTVADVGLLTGEIPSEAVPSPWYFTDPDHHKDLFHIFSDKANARTLKGSICDRLPSLVGNKLLVLEHIEEYDHDKDKYHAFKIPHSALGTFQVLYLHDFDQGRCKTLRRLSPHPERQDLEARLKERNPDARVTVVSRMFYTSIEDVDDTEKDTSPEWKTHIRELWEIEQAREKGEAEFPVLEFDDPPEGRDDPRLLFTRSMICLPKIRDGEAFALTTSAILELPLYNADGYVHYFGKE
ncbi:hypothetical protein V8C37DRAFT_370772 [Trichoderma ceciliae]